MKTPTQENSHFIETLQQCIKDCELIITTQAQLPGRERCIELCKLCIDACYDSLDACQSVGHGIGNMLQHCVDACKSCARECKRLAYAMDLNQNFPSSKVEESSMNNQLSLQSPQ